MTSKNFTGAKFIQKYLAVVKFNTFFICFCVLCKSLKVFLRKWCFTLPLSVDSSLRKIIANDHTHKMRPYYLSVRRGKLKLALAFMHKRYALIATSRRTLKKVVTGQTPAHLVVNHVTHYCRQVSKFSFFF